MRPGRRSVRYPLTRGVLQAVLALPLVAFVAHLALHTDTNWMLLALLAGAAISLSARAKVVAWVDRKFFRESYDSERILLDLIDDISHLDSASEISRRVGDRLSTALHPTQLHVDFSLPADGTQRLAASEIELVVPVLGASGRLLGAVLLGEKRSGQLYSSRDRRMLEAVAAQMGVVYENLELKDQVARDRRLKVDVLARLDREHVDLLRECPKCGACYDAATRSCAADGTELQLTLPVERVVDGKYRLDRRIGRGGMGAVFEATDLRLGRHVAVKLLTGMALGDGSAVRRFEREARAVARLDDEHVVAIHDYGTVGEDGAYLVMEMVEGATLRDEMRRRGPISGALAAEWFGQIFAAVRAAHEAGIVHRDLKPENVLISHAPDGRPRVKVVDFGLAKTALPGDASVDCVTQPGIVMGTLGYMSPEQLMGDPVDERGDVFSLGVMVAEAVFGRRPFASGSWADVARSIARGKPDLPDGVDAAGRLGAVLRRSVAVVADTRLQSVRELEERLLPALREYRAPHADARVVSDAAPTRVLKPVSRFAT